MRWLALSLGLGACSLHFDFSGTHYQCSDGKCPSGFMCVASQCVAGALDGDGGGDAADGVSVQSWWDTTYAHRAQLTITNAATTPLPVGFEIGVHVDLGTLDSPSATFDALRVVRLGADGVTWTEQPRYIETAGSNQVATVWWKLGAAVAPSATSTSDWLYFSNPSASTAPNAGPQVFDLLFDGFDAATINTTTWAVQGTPTSGGSTVTLHPSDALHSMTAFAPGTAVMGAMIAPPNVPRFWVGLQPAGFADSQPWILWINRAADDTDAPPNASPATIWPETFIGDIGMVKPDWGPAMPLAGELHEYAIQRLADRIVFKYDEAVAYQLALPQTFATALDVRLSNEGTANIEIGTVLVRHAVWPDPMVAIGATESQ